MQLQRQEEPGSSTGGSLARGCGRGSARGSAAPPAWHGHIQPWHGSTDTATSSSRAGHGAARSGTRLWAVCHRRRPRTGASAPPQVRTAASPWCRGERRDRDVTVPGWAAPRLLLARLNQIAVYNWIRQLFFKGYALHTIKIHVFFR